MHSKIDLTICVWIPLYNNLDSGIDTHPLITSCFTDCSYQGEMYNIGQGFPASSNPADCNKW